MTQPLYYEQNADGSGFAFIDGEPEYFRSSAELHQIGLEFYPQGYELYLVTPENWQQLYDMGVFEHENDY
ncbi:hypothetical protein Q4491_04380 [Photobacterium sp. 2_MG-2023]|uniref:Uncharacterized protein n=2 Tax=Photobacterium TaxID=657 RepID=A0A7X4W9Z2_9GAMM|nr:MULTISPECIES: hypothetical protein [Photobacterium]MBD8514474.1 hypothetical protein [Photobacterium arenosum]MDO6580574.1 hypothetical protein [Photobacterium sp. 2_MG-2023]NAW64537.1 hypothetical protein [Photobacterium halotolerans]